MDDIHQDAAFEILDTEEDLLIHIARLRASSSLKLPECAVLVTAEEFGATLATFDRRLASVARERGVAVVGVRTLRYTGITSNL